MSKTLVIKYLPRGERSKTRRLLDVFLKETEGKTEITTVNVGQEPPELLTDDRLNAYMARYYGGVSLEEESAKLLTPIEDVLTQLESHDYVVVVSPIYNWGAPAPLKAWFDLAVIPGRTFMIEGTAFKGLMSGKALSLSTSGGADIPEFRPQHAAVHYTPDVLDFMGFETDAVNVEKTNESTDEELTASFEKAEQQIRDIVSNWYS